MKKTGKLFVELANLMAFLRSKKGCPWDRTQTYRSLKTCLIEEACEIADSIDKRSDEKLKEELGDLLYIIIFYAQIAKEKKSFTIDDVMSKAYAKLKRRHPHVFGEMKLKSPDKIIDHWHKIKAQENKDSKNRSSLSDIPAMLSSLHKAMKVQRKVSAAGGEFVNVKEALDDLKRKAKSLSGNLKTKKKTQVSRDIGDLLFAVVAFARLMHLDPEEALYKKVDLFVSRFKKIEKYVRS